MKFKYKHGSPLYKKRTNKIYKKAVEDTARDKTTQTLILNFLAICAEALNDEFGFGPKRLNRWKNRVEYKLSCIEDDYVNWEDIRGNIELKEK